MPAIVEFVDIAGLVAGASQGEGLGNQFLAHIRETDAIVNVVRCFEDDNVIHVANKGRSDRRHRGDPDQLCLADLGRSEEPAPLQQGGALGQRQGSCGAGHMLEKCPTALLEGKPVRVVEFSDAEQVLLKPLCLMPPSRRCSSAT